MILYVPDLTRPSGGAYRPASPDDIKAAGYVSIEQVRAWFLRIDYAAPYGSNAQTIARAAVKALDQTNR